MPVVKFPDGGGAIICTRPQLKLKSCDWCDQPSHFLCDFETGPGTTCDKRMCMKHVTRIAYGVGRCPQHLPPGQAIREAA